MKRGTLRRRLLPDWVKRRSTPERRRKGKVRDAPGSRDTGHTSLFRARAAIIESPEHKGDRSRRPQEEAAALSLPGQPLWLLSLLLLAFVVAFGSPRWAARNRHKLHGNRPPE